MSEPRSASHRPRSWPVSSSGTPLEKPSPACTAIRRERKISSQLGFFLGGAAGSVPTRALSAHEGIRAEQRREEIVLLGVLVDGEDELVAGRRALVAVGALAEAARRA